MEKLLSEFKLEIIRMLQVLKNNDWDIVKLSFIFPPYINKGYTGTQDFLDSDGNKVKIVLFLDEEASRKFFDFIINFNQENKFNEIHFYTKKNDYENAAIYASFNEEVENTFQNNLTKAQKGKTIPWWKNENETKEI